MRISARFQKSIADIRASYWFVPTILVVLAMVLAQITLILDHRPDVLPFSLKLLASSVSVDGARAVLTAVATSMIGVAGVMFSITMVAVSFASGQYGPRLIGNFMRDRGNQWSLGLLIAAFAYALLILRAVQSPDGVTETVFVPHLSVFVAMLWAFIGVFTVIYHVHHVPETISVSNIIAGLGRRFVAEIDRLAAFGPQAEQPASLPEPHFDITMHIAGYVHSIAFAQLSDIATTKNWHIEILAEPGDFVHTRSPMLRIHGTDALGEDDCTKLRQGVALGDAKTEDQNLFFIAEQLVEIVGRAMSPGVNDPFTAISCLQWMGAGLAHAAESTKPLTTATEAGLTMRPISFDDLLEQTMGASLAYVKPDDLARNAMIDILTKLTVASGTTISARVSIERLLAALSTDLG